MADYDRLAPGETPPRSIAAIRDYQRTVLDHCTRRLGVRRGAAAASSTAQWTLATRDLGHVPTGAEYATYWAVTDRTAWNHAARVAAAFGNDWRAVVEQLAAAIDVLVSERSPRAVMRLRAPAAESER